MAKANAPEKATTASEPDLWAPMQEAAQDKFLASLPDQPVDGTRRIYLRDGFDAGWAAALACVSRECDEAN